MYFAREYDPTCALTAVDDRGLTVSSLLLQPYSMSFHGSDTGISYISGAATMPRYRGQGFMTRLIHEALILSHSRGDMLCTLIPASRKLRFYYARMGFADVFYTRLHRYTSTHTFAGQATTTTHRPVTWPDSMKHMPLWRQCVRAPCATRRDSSGL